MLWRCSRSSTRWRPIRPIWSMRAGMRWPGMKLPVASSRGAETGLLPDVGFYGAALFPRVTDRSQPIPFAPEFAVEVASPDQEARVMAAKALRYLRGGARLVW